MGAERRFITLHRATTGYTAEGLMRLLERRRKEGMAANYLVVEVVETRRWYLTFDGRIDRNDIRNHPLPEEEVPPFV